MNEPLLCGLILGDGHIVNRRQGCKATMAKYASVHKGYV